MKIKIIYYDKKFLNLSWDWLNDSEIKKLTNTPDFKKEDQVKWFESLIAKKDYFIWGVTVDEKPIGVCGIKKITQEDCEYWGYIGEKEYWGKGIGKVIINLMEEEAKKLNLKSIWLQVLENNERAVALYKKTGYIAEKTESGLIFMRKNI